MNSQIVKGKWNEFKGEVRKMWGDLTDNELEQTKGNVEAIGGLLQRKYGNFKDDTKTGFNSLVERFGEGMSEKSEQVKNSVRANVDEDTEH